MLVLSDLIFRVNMMKRAEYDVFLEILLKKGIYEIMEENRSYL